MTDTVALVANELVRIETDRETLVATPEHPFARVGSGWTRADELASGDVIESARQQGPVTIQAVRKSKVAPTRVYNLSVAPGRAYYVGWERLLVHNTDCGQPSRPLVDDRPEFREHCGYCTLAALSDRSVTALERELGIVANEDGMRHRMSRELLRRLGLISSYAQYETWSRKEASETGRTVPEAVEEYMRNDSQSNTFEITYYRRVNLERPPGSGQFASVLLGHIILAVRQEDGSILYIDLQIPPPRTSRSLNPDTQWLKVWRTTVDYRFNRHIWSAIHHGTPVSVIL